MSGNIGRSPAAPLIFPPSPRLASDARRLPAVTERMGLNKDLCRHPLAASTFQPVSQTSAAEVKAPLAPLPLRPPRLTFDSTEGAEVTIDLPFFLRPHFLSPVMYLCPSCQNLSTLQLCVHAKVLSAETPQQTSGYSTDERFQ